MSKTVWERCDYCNELVRCNEANPRKSMANHQNKPVCYQKPSFKKQKIANHGIALKENESAVEDMDRNVERNGAMKMDIHMLQREIQVLPLPEFLEEYVFQDPALNEQHNQLPAEMDISSDRETKKMFGKTLVFRNDDEDFVYKDEDAPQPSFAPFLFQKKLEKDYFDELKRNRNARSQRRSKSELGSQVGLKPVDSVVLDLAYIHSVKKGFTTSGVDDMLSLMDQITQITFNRTVNKTQWRTTKKSYDKFVDVFSPLKRPEFVLPSEMYGQDDKGKSLRPYYGVSVHILEEIGFELLKVKNVKDSFVYEYEHMQNSNGDHLTGPFHTAERFKRLDSFVKKHHGEDAVPLCLALYSDPTKLNPTMTRNAHPVYLSILNILHSKPIFVGFVPYGVHNFDILEDLLSVNKRINVNKLKDEILGCLRPSDMMRFFEFLLDPLFDLAENGIAWQVGRGIESEIRRFIPFLVSLLGDELMQAERSGCSYQCKNYSCGRCLRKNCFSFHNDTINNDNTMGSYVTFQYNNRDHQSFVLPYKISGLKVTDNSERMSTKQKILEFSVMTNLYVFDEDDGDWYNIETSPHKVYVNAKLKKRLSSTTYKVCSIQRKRGVRINTNEVLPLDDDRLQDLTTIRRPFSGLCNFELGGTWKKAVVVRDSDNQIDVVYDDGDIENNIPHNRFIYLEAPRKDYQMNILSEGKLSILLRRIEHFRSTGAKMYVWYECM
jgi:hypothetical protein